MNDLIFGAAVAALLLAHGLVLRSAQPEPQPAPPPEPERDPDYCFTHKEIEPKDKR